MIRRALVRAGRMGPGIRTVDSVRGEVPAAARAAVLGRVLGRVLGGALAAVLAGVGLLCLAATPVRAATPVAAATSGEPGFRPPLGGSSCGVTSTACSVQIRALPQIGAMWCVPAAASAIIDGVADQAYLARMMKTNENGTLFRRVPGALAPFSDYQFAFSRGRASYRDADGLVATVRYQVGVLHRALILGVEGDLLPYWPPGVTGAHAVVVSGWHGPYLIVWDPLRESWNLRASGFHLVLPEALARAGQGNSRAMIR